MGKSWYGPGFTPAEQASQVALWAVLASPLIVSFDIRNMDSDCKALVMNPRCVFVPDCKPGAPSCVFRLLLQPLTEVSDHVG